MSVLLSGLIERISKIDNLTCQLITAYVYELVHCAYLFVVIKSIYYVITGQILCLHLI